MKTTLKTIVLGLALATLTNGYAQKIGYVRIDSLIQMMPESVKAGEEGNAFYKSLESRVMTMQNELKTKYDSYQQKSAANSFISATEKTDLEKEITDFQQRIQDFQTSAQTELQKKNAELSKPIYDKANGAIKAVAKENGYKFIFDTSAGYLAYAEPGDDVMGLVLKKLGIDPTKIVRPVQTTPKVGGK